MRIGHVEVENGVLLAPMEDVSDMPFRVICRRLGADIVYTEFISSEGLVRDAWRSRQKLALAPEERPVAIQIFGGDTDVMKEAAQISEEAQPDFIDINCGCWVKNVVARAAGAALLRDPDRMVHMAKTLVDAVKLPVTVKTRLGWDGDNIIILDLAKRLEEEAGIAALAIHCRTRDMGHSGAADWHWVEKVKRNATIPIILNGDVETPQDVRDAFQTGCDAVMIGRAAIANPFLFRQAKTFMATGVEEPPPSIRERIELCLEHLRWSVKYRTEHSYSPSYLARHSTTTHSADNGSDNNSGNSAGSSSSKTTSNTPEARAIREFRKFYAGYMKGLHGGAPVRKDLMTYETFTAVEQRLWQYHEELMQRGEQAALEQINLDDLSETPSAALEHLNHLESPEAASRLAASV
jgi:tRNA-dihydrouridine synthase B